MITVKRILNAPADSKALRVTITIDLEDALSPSAEKAYKGLALLVREILTPEEQAEFLAELNAQRATLTTLAPNAEKVMRAKLARKKRAPKGGAQ